MAKPILPIVITHDLSIMPLEKERAYPISVSDWAFLKRKISCIDSGSFLFQTIGSILLGVSGSAFLTLKTIPDSPSGGNTVVILWAIGLATASVGALLLWIAHQERLQVASSKNAVVEEMNRLENRYAKSPMES
jgi:hypothetical protein